MRKVVKLGDVCNIVNGSTPLRSDKRYWKNGKVFWFTIEDMRKQGRDIKYTIQKVTKLAVEEKKVKLVPKDSVLLCCTASVGEVAISRAPMATNQQFNALTPKSNIVTTEYLYYFASTLKKRLLRVSGSTTINFVSLSKLKELTIPLPPLNEQQRIVSKLDAAFAEINKNVEVADKKVIKIDKLKSKLLLSFLNRNDEKFHNFKLSDVCTINNGGTPKSDKKSYWGGKIEWLTPKDMGKMTDKYISKTERQITSEGLAHSSAKLIPENSIILSCRAPIGHIAINKVSMSFNQGCKGLVPNDKILFEFLYYFLFSSKEFLNDLGTGTTFKEISSKTLSNINISLPTIIEQRDIIKKIDEVFKQLKIVNKYLIKSKINYKLLKEAIIKKELQTEIS